MEQGRFFLIFNMKLEHRSLHIQPFNSIVEYTSTRHVKLSIISASIRPDACRR
uniref:Uncharacterized protein n=1 Tax=Arundo donax TaxID=35708 RepID=A0A0A9D192_ARUDO